MSLLRDIAEIVTGLQAPYSIKPQMLGTAGPAWVKVRRALRLGGWNDVNEVEEALRARLSEKEVEG